MLKMRNLFFYYFSLPPARSRTKGRGLHSHSPTAPPLSRTGHRQTVGDGAQARHSAGKNAAGFDPLLKFSRAFFVLMARIGSCATRAARPSPTAANLHSRPAGTFSAGHASVVRIEKSGAAKERMARKATLLHPHFSLIPAYRHAREPPALQGL